MNDDDQHDFDVNGMEECVDLLMLTYRSALECVMNANIEIEATAFSLLSSGINISRTHALSVVLELVGM